MYRGTTGKRRHDEVDDKPGSPQLLLIPELCPGGQSLTCGPTLSTNQIRPWD